MWYNNPAPSPATAADYRRDAAALREEAGWCDRDCDARRKLALADASDRQADALEQRQAA